MKENIIATMMAALFVTSGQPTPVPTVQPVVHEQVVSTRSMSLANRYPVKSVSDVFRDNILLTIYYMTGKVSDPSQIKWDEIRKPMHAELTLQPGEVFAFHDDVLPQYRGKTIKTTKSHFNGAEGFLSDGYLYGDGVCHLASLINWAARDAGLNVTSLVNHNFANVPEVPREYGVSIYATGGNSATGQAQNLYIENNKDRPVTFVFDYANENLTVKVTEK